MKKIIEVDILERDDLFERYNMDQISKSLIDYIINETPDLKKKDKLKIIINNKFDNNIEIIKPLKKSFKEEYDKSYNKHLKINFFQSIYFVLGLVILFFATKIDVEVFREVISICGSVLIWTMVEMEMFSDMDERKRRTKLKKIIAAEIIEIKGVNQDD